VENDIRVEHEQLGMGILHATSLRNMSTNSARQTAGAD
jgi:hypothetical protein